MVRGPGEEEVSSKDPEKKLLTMVLEALEARGGVDYLAKLEDHLFVSLLCEAMPREHEVKHSGHTALF